MAGVFRTRSDVGSVRRAQRREKGSGMKMVAVTHPTGNANVRAVLSGLRRAGCLSEFHTSFGVSSASSWYRLLPAVIKRQLGRRAYDLPPRMLRTRPVREVVRLAS